MKLIEFPSNTKASQQKMSAKISGCLCLAPGAPAPAYRPATPATPPWQRPVLILHGSAGATPRPRAVTPRPMVVRPSPRPTLAAPSGRTVKHVRPAWERPRPRPQAASVHQSVFRAAQEEWTNEEWGGNNGWGDGEWSGDTKGEWEGEGEFWDEGHEGHEDQWNEDEQGQWNEDADAPADQGWTNEMGDWEADDESAEWAAPVQPTDAEAVGAEWHEAEDGEENEVENDTPYHLTLGWQSYEGASRLRQLHDFSFSLSHGPKKLS